MFVDASAIVAILGREPGHEEIEKRLVASEEKVFVSPLVTFEAAMALARKKTGDRKPSADLLHQARQAVGAFVEDVGAEEVSISPEIGRMAFDAGAVYGKAVGHAADLNFGDCFAYACAKALGTGLLYKGYDFLHTDLA